VTHLDQSDAQEWSHALSEQAPDRLSELLIERYDAQDQKVGESQWADEWYHRCCLSLPK
jgi:hypothetical protein